MSKNWEEISAKEEVDLTVCPGTLGFTFLVGWIKVFFNVANRVKKCYIKLVIHVVLNGYQTG